MTATRLMLAVLVLSLPLAAQAPVTEKPNEIEAVVNDKVVTTRDVLERFEKRKIDLATFPISQQQVEFRAMLRDIVFDMLEREAAKKAGVEITRDQLADQLTQYIEQERGGEAAFENFLDQQNLTRDAFVEQFRQDREAEAWRRVVSGTGGGVSRLSRELRPLYDVSVTPREIRRRYERDLETVYTVKDAADVRVLQIYFKRGPREPGQTQQKILGLKQRLETRADFAVLAEKNSDHPSKAEGGLIARIEKGVGDRVPAEIEAAIFAEGVQEGDVLGPLLNVNSYWLVKVEKLQKARVIPFEEAQADVRAALVTAKRTAAVRQVLLDLVKEAHIWPRSLDSDLRILLSGNR